MADDGYDGVLLDFYGTVVHEDGVVIAEICAAIERSATEPASASAIGAHWWTVLARSLGSSHGRAFETQRELERRSLDRTIAHYGADGDGAELAQQLFDHWRQPPIFADALALLDALGGRDVPVAVVSNIDRDDIEAAIEHHGLAFDHVITSEDVRSYKPRPEPFLAGLEALGCQPGRALHVGDSLTSDVAGARRLDLAVAWINRAGRPAPAGGNGPTHVVVDLEQLIPVIGSGG